MKFILISLSFVNIVTFFVYGIDKFKAKKHLWRTPEVTLILLAVFGGSIGAMAGMRVWHHKTLHKKFRYGVPAIFVLQLILIGIVIWLKQEINE